MGQLADIMGHVMRHTEGLSSMSIIQGYSVVHQQVLPTHHQIFISYFPTDFNKSAAAPDLAPFPNIINTIARPHQRPVTLLRPMHLAMAVLISLSFIKISSYGHHGHDFTNIYSPALTPGIREILINLFLRPELISNSS